MIENGVVYIGVMVGLEVGISCLDFDIVEPFLNDSQLQRWAETWAGRWALAAFFFAGRPGRPWAAGRV